jgi:gliding motility-associated-like protein
MFKKYLFITLLFLTFFTNVKAQIDTSFWFVAPDISQGLGDRPIYLFFNTYGQAATVKVRQPANGAFVPITKVIPANSIDSINLTAFIASIENNTANTVLNNGLYISSTQKISTLYSIKSTANKEYLSLKGPKALGVDFYVPMQEFWNQAPATSPKSFSSFDIVASQNNTTVLITPKTAIIGHAANATFTVLLQQGQTFSCQDTARSATTSLAGSIVSANKPIAISIQSSGLNQSGCLSSVTDQITNSTYIGTDYIVNKGKSITEKIFVLATQNNTQITVNDGSTTTHVSNFGENYIYTASQPITYVSANKPVYVFHVSGYGCRLSGAQLPPFFCAGTFTTSFTRTASDSLALNLFTRTGFEGSFALNGNASLIPASAFTVVPGSSGNIKSAKLYYSTATIPVGSHNVVTNSGDVFGLGTLNGSSVRGSAYAYHSEFVSYPSINAGSNFTLCANGTLALNGQIGGGNINGTWSTNGFGTFNAGFTALTNTYTPSQLDTTVKPVKIFLTTNGPCPQQKDTLLLSVKPSPLVNASIDQIVCGNNNTVTVNGSVSGASSTGIWSSTGTGTFTPNNTTLNASYLPSVADTITGSVKLILTSTANGICGLARDTMNVTITKVPLANAGPASVSVCANNPTVALNGTIGGITSTGKWTSNGSGSFSPSNIQLNTGYIPSAADILAGQVKLYLSSTGNGTCVQAKDSILVVFTTAPSVNAGTDIYSCKNNLASALSGTISGPTTTGIWSGGTGTFTPNNSVLNPTYTPSAAEVTAGVVNLSLTSTSNGSCNQVVDQVLIIINSSPVVNAGLDLSSCKNNAASALSGVVSGTTTTGIWSNGTGTFTPSNTNLNAIYSPSAAELTAGFVNLILTSTNNANCNSVKDTVKINFTNSPTANAGIDLTACKNNVAKALSGVIGGATTTGIWSGGAGSFNPSNSVLTATYTANAAEIAAGFVKLVLTSTNNGNCNSVNDTVKITFTPAPLVNAGVNLSYCKNNPATVLSGTVSGGSTTGIWSGGSGTFSPSSAALNATYTPSAAELTAGSVNLILTSTSNGNCNQVTDNVLIVYSSAPSVNAGIDLSSCKNNSASALSGVISGTTTTGIWSNGTGTFTPSNTNLNAIYSPSASELTTGFVNLILTSTANGNCNSVKDTVRINFTNPPTANAGVDLTACKNNVAKSLSGVIAGSTTTGIWSGGAGSFNPSNSVLTATYTANAAEIATGFVKLVLTSTNNGNCNSVNDTVKITFTPAPIVNAGVNLSYCKNNPATVLSGTVSGGSTTGIWSGGSGTFSPSSAALNATYTPSASELTAGSVNLILTSTSNGNCNQVTDNVLIVYTAAPSVNAGVDLSACKNNSASALAGVVSGTTTTGIWSGGTGTFTPNNTNLNAIYSPSAAELTTGFVKLILTSTANGNCNSVKDTVRINFINSPTANAGVDLTACKNNVASPLSGLVAGPTTTGIWTGGAGSFNPSNSVLTATYTANAAEIAAGFVKLVLTSTNNGNCNSVYDTVKITFTSAPIVNAGVNLSYCKNNAASILSGTVSGGSTTGIWSGGSGTFSPNNTDLNATYSPSAAELTAGSVNLILTSTSNGNCNQVTDNVLIVYTTAPSVNAGVDLSSCENNPVSILSGIVSGPTATGIWAGGTGTFSPNNTTLNATYIPSAADLSAGAITLTLTSTGNGNCNQAIDSVKINFTPSPIVNAGIDLTTCKNNIVSVLSGSVSGGTTTGIWSGGSGSFNPSNSVLTATYSPNTTELTAGFVNLILTSTNNGNCILSKDTVKITFTPSPVVNAGINLTACKNNASSVLSGTVSGGSTTGIWSGGTGTFTPNNTDLNATYSPSASELAAGSINLILTSTNNGNCTQVNDNVLIVFTTAPSVNAGIDLFSCKNNAYSILSGIVSGPTTTGTWTGGTGTFTPSNAVLNATYTPSASEILAGFVNLALTSTNNGNCSQTVDSVKINYTNGPTVNAGLNLSSCKNNPGIALAGLVSGPTSTGTWYGGTGSFNPSNTVLTATYTPSAAEVASGSVSLILASTNNGNCIQSSDTVVINYTNPPTVNAGLDLSSCKNNAPIALGGFVNGPTTTGIWSGGAGTFNPSSAVLNATYTPSAAEISVGFVNLTLTSSNNGNCNSVNDLIKLNFVPKPFANFNFNNVCLNNSSSFTDFSLPGIGTLSSWEWSFGDNTTSVNQNTIHTYSTSGTFTAQLVVSNSYGCYDTIKKSPTVYPLPSADFGINRVCNGNILNLNFSDSSTVQSPETVTQWLWNFILPPSIIQSNLQNPSQLFPGSGLYDIKLIATSNHGCKDTIIKQVNLTPRPSAGFEYAVSSGVNVGTTVSFVDTSSYATGWNWNFGDANNTGSALQNPSTIYYENGVFIVTQIVRDDYGCTDTARVAIKINNITNEISTLIPNAISPNGDGKNDVWKLEFLKLLYPNAEIDIFSRWGENIYNSTGSYSEPWDGTYKGAKLPVGTYYYVINLNDATITEPLKGGILLIR